jgi:[ribosomal protein S5]-alanine N-acetyltransferase
LSILRSPRVDLVSMGPALLEALLAGDHVNAAEIGGFQIPNTIVLRKRTIQMRLRQMQANPEVLPWLLRAIVVKQSQIMCGYIGFHSEPGPEDLGVVAADGVELGYAIGESFRRQGFAKEAALRLMRWAFDCHGQQCFVLSIAPDNEASLALARSMGFVEIGSHIDEEDGVELYFQRRLDHWPDEWG